MVIILFSLSELLEEFIDTILSFDCVLFSSSELLSIEDSSSRFNSLSLSHFFSVVETLNLFSNKRGKSKDMMFWQKYRHPIHFRPFFCSLLSVCSLSPSRSLFFSFLGAANGQFVLVFHDKKYKIRSTDDSYTIFLKL